MHTDHFYLLKAKCYFCQWMLILNELMYTSFLMPLQNPQSIYSILAFLYMEYYRGYAQTMPTSPKKKNSRCAFNEILKKQLFYHAMAVRYHPSSHRFAERTLKIGKAGLLKQKTAPPTT